MYITASCTSRRHPGIVVTETSIVACEYIILYVCAFTAFGLTGVEFVLVDHARHRPRHERVLVARSLVVKRSTSFDLSAQTLAGDVSGVGALEAQEQTLDDEQVDTDELTETA